MREQFGRSLILTLFQRLVDSEAGAKRKRKDETLVNEKQNQNKFSARSDGKVEIQSIQLRRTMNDDSN